MKTFLVFFMLGLGYSSQASTVGLPSPLVFCAEGSPSTFNPQLATDGTTINASSRQIYNRLVDFEGGGTKIVPSLASAWKISRNGLEYTFELRKDVSFHSSKDFTPSRNFNAEDVLFSFNRMRLKSHPYHLVNGGVYSYFEAMDMGKLIKDIVKVNDFSVRFVLTRKEAPFLANLAIDASSILSAEYGDFLLKKKLPEKIDTEPIGTGPFRLVRYVKDSQIRYERNSKYFLGEPKIDPLVFAITPDPSVRIQKLKTGECQVVTEPNREDLSALEANPKIQVLHKPGLNVGYLAMNVEKAPFDNLKVRLAVYHALNRESYLKPIFSNRAQVAKNPLPPTVWSYNDDIKDYPYDPSKAKALLAEAGYPNGFDTELWTLPVSRPYNPKGKKMGELMQADLAKIGIRAKLVTYDWPTYLAKSRAGEHKMIQMGWTGDNGDPDNFLKVLLSCSAVSGGGNLSRWCNPKFDTWVEKGKAVTDIKKRTESYRKAQEIFHQEVPWVPIAYAETYKALSHGVRNYQVSPFSHENFAFVTLEGK